MVDSLPLGATQTRRVRLHPRMFAPRIARRMVYEIGDAAGLPGDLVDNALANAG